MSIAAPATAKAATPRTSLPAIERQVMCVTCKIPLMVAESAQADRERAFIQGLIGQGESEAQIKQALVAQYGPQVLALPAAHGFGIAAYLVPLVTIALVLGVLALLLPRWRRGSSTRKGEAEATDAKAEAEAEAEGGGSISPSDAARLDADLARFH